MKRVTKSILVGLGVGGAAYGVDYAVSRRHRHAAALAIIPGLILGVSSGLFTWIVSRPEPVGDFPEEMGYYDWPLCYPPDWTYEEGINLPRISMPDGTAGGMRSR